MTSNSRVRRPTAAAGLVILLTSTGVLHFAAPASFDMIVPEQLPGAARTWTHLSGVAELLVAALIAVPRTRRFGGLLAALLFVAVFPANVKMVIDWSDRPVWMRALAYGRLPLQIPLVLAAVLVYRGSGAAGNTTNRRCDNGARPAAVCATARRSSSAGARSTSARHVSF